MKILKFTVIALAISVGGMIGLGDDVVGQMNAWMSGKNHDRIIQIQNEGGTRTSTDSDKISFYSNSSFGITYHQAYR